jgi:hypothetical protein
VLLDARFREEFRELESRLAERFTTRSEASHRGGGDPVRAATASVTHYYNQRSAS